MFYMLPNNFKVKIYYILYMICKVTQFTAVHVPRVLSDFLMVFQYEKGDACYFTFNRRRGIKVLLSCVKVWN